MKLSLYIHIPFCKKFCHYCDFYKVLADDSSVDMFIKALLDEWQMLSNTYSLNKYEMDTIYFGGGTPSCLSPQKWQILGHRFLSILPKTENCECSMECNPDSFAVKKAQIWLEHGINRLSIGIQSMNDLLLKNIGRIHDSQQVRRVLEQPLLSQFSSIGVDFMYGLPGQDLEIFEKDLREVLQYDVVQHLSAYELTLAEGTSLWKDRDKLCFSDEDSIVEMVYYLQKICSQYGFSRYEISNYSKPGHRCRHNMVYWAHEPYIGLGPSAHSYLPPYRFYNTSDVRKYVNCIQNKELPIEEKEHIDANTMLHELIFLGLRTTEGLDERKFLKMTSQSFYSGKRKATIDLLQQKKLICREENHWILTEEGMLLADAIARQLF